MSKSVTATWPKRYLAGDEKKETRRLFFIGKTIPRLNFFMIGFSTIQFLSGWFTHGFINIVTNITVQLDLLHSFTASLPESPRWILTYFDPWPPWPPWPRHRLDVAAHTSSRYFSSFNFAKVLKTLGRALRCRRCSTAAYCSILQLSGLGSEKIGWIDVRGLYP